VRLFGAWNFNVGRNKRCWIGKTQKGQHSLGQIWAQKPGLWALVPVFFLWHSVGKSLLSLLLLFTQMGNGYLAISTSSSPWQGSTGEGGGSEWLLGGPSESLMQRCPLAVSCYSLYPPQPQSWPHKAARCSSSLLPHPGEGAICIYEDLKT
jgi:hypothetical protein